MTAITRGRLLTAMAGMALAGTVPLPARAQDALPANDLLLASLWMQRSVEYRANCLAAFALARIRLDQALADPKWTGAPVEQTGAYESLPPAIIAALPEARSTEKRPEPIATPYSLPSGAKRKPAGSFISGGR